MTEPLVLAALLVWGTVVGVDLVSFPQAMLNRPIVAATVAGMIVGDPESGLRVGVLLELFALDVLPIGAARYPDFGPGAVAATLVAGSGVNLLGVAAVLGLVMALAGGRSVDLLRRVNGRRIRAADELLSGGDPTTVHRLHVLGLATDVVRSGVLTAVGLALAVPAARVAAISPALDRSLTLTILAGGLAAALHGLVQRAWAGGPRFWLTAGLLAGGVVAWLA